MSREVAGNSEQDRVRALISGHFRLHGGQNWPISKKGVEDDAIETQQRRSERRKLLKEQEETAPEESRTQTVELSSVLHCSPPVAKQRPGQPAVCMC